MNIIPFGALVRDTITGFKGIVTCRVEHMNSCIRYEVQPLVDKKEEKLPESKMFDGPDLKIIAPPKGNLPPVIKTDDAFKLGVKVKDRLTGFTGVAVLRIKYRHSGDRYGIQAPMNGKGEIPDIRTFDELDLEQVDPPPAPKGKTKPKKPYGPHGHNTAIAR